MLNSSGLCPRTITCNGPAYRIERRRASGFLMAHCRAILRTQQRSFVHGSPAVDATSAHENAQTFGVHRTPAIRRATSSGARRAERGLAQILRAAKIGLSIERGGRRRPVDRTHHVDGPPFCGDLDRGGGGRKRGLVVRAAMGTAAGGRGRPVSRLLQCQVHRQSLRAWRRFTVRPHRRQIIAAGRMRGRRRQQRNSRPSRKCDQESTGAAVTGNAHRGA